MLRLCLLFCRVVSSSSFWLGGLCIAVPSTCALAQGPATGTTVFRCVDSAGVVSFADTPCTGSASRRLRIEHSSVQSAPLSVADQQRLNALAARLQQERDAASKRRLQQRRSNARRAQTAATRCTAAGRALTELKARKRRGYPVRQAQRIDREQEALEDELQQYCARVR